MGKLITHEQFEKRRETKPLPLVSYNEKQSAEILPFSKNIILRYQRNRRGKLRLQIAELRKTLIAIGLPTNEEFMLFVICYWSDQQEIQSLAKSDQYRHLKKQKKKKKGNRAWLFLSTGASIMRPIDKPLPSGARSPTF